ncbi:hypothetical protein QJQ45_009420 [Haematococcus lacustris]|nr:hypothetical protein QJQ45_009420 [Haematococcus lacustris]
MAQRRAAEAEAKAQAGAAEAETQAQADAGAYEADEAGADEAGAYEVDAGAYEAEAQAQADARAYEAQLHQLQPELQQREQQATDTQRLQHLQQQLQDLQQDELQRKEQQVAEQQQQLQQQQADMHLREQQLAEQQHQLQQQQADMQQREQQVAQQQQQVQQQQADLQLREQQVAQQHHQVQQQQADLQLREQQVATQKHQVQQQQADLQLREQQVAQQHHQVQLQQQLDRLQQQLEAQSGAELQRQVQQQLAAQQHLLQQQQADLLLKRSEFESSRQSSSASYVTKRAMDKVLLEYVWIGPLGSLQSQTRVLDEKPPSIEHVPVVIIEAEGGREAYLKPRKLFRDPFRGGDHLLCLCDSFQPPQVDLEDLYAPVPPLQPHPTNMRVPCQEVITRAGGSSPLLSAKHEFCVYEEADEHSAIGDGTWPHPHLPDPSLPYVNAPRGAAARGGGGRPGKTSAVGRNVSDSHLQHCLAAGVPITGTGQDRDGVWSYKLGPCTGVEFGDQIWMSRHILLRVAEGLGATVVFGSSGSDYPGCHLHVKFSTTETRQPGLGILSIKRHLAALQATHLEHTLAYGSPGRGPGSSGELGLTVPSSTLLRRSGYYIDRRPVANCDPYTVAMLLSASSLGIPMPCKLQMATQLPVAVPSSHKSGHSMCPRIAGREVWGAPSCSITSSMNTEDVLLDELDRMDGECMRSDAAVNALLHIDSAADSSCRYLQAHTLIFRKNCCSVMTEDDLVAIGMALLDFHNSFRSGVAAHMCGHTTLAASTPSKTMRVTTKYHMLGHVVDTIRDMGGMMDVPAQFFEASHRNVKLCYRLINNTEAMVRARLLMQPEPRQLSTLLQQASTWRQHCRASRISELSVDMHNHAHISHIVRLHCILLHVMQVDWEPDCSVAQTVRSTPCFYNRPWFDNGVLNTEPESFAQLCLLFTAGDMKLAMVRSYQELPPREQAAQVLSKHGNTRLRWAQQGHSYEALQIAFIKRREFVLLDWCKKDGQHFHLCKGKWDRSEADSRSLATINKEGFVS